ncbi:LysR family transcriptional regulator [Kribbella sp. HUAS MG21]|uniref:LysR family transcriptional regulator n=1 Tax=Kribbella sp. HUAS MG21 TaxID=3160966 RepID=A0AAU7TFG6_9ACTN
MDPHLLRTFVTVAECGSFSAAATRLGYTQSAVSQHIAALENDLGTPLLHRRPVTPTPSGERLLEHAGPILLRLDAARADVRRTVTAPPTTLTIAASPLAARSLAAHLAAVRRTHPGTELALTIYPRAQVPEAVATGTHTIGLTDGVTAPTDPLPITAPLNTTPTTQEPLAITLPRSHPLAHTTPPTPAVVALPAAQAEAGPAPAADPHLAGRASHPASTVRSGLSLSDLVDARWIDAPDLAAPLTALRTAAGSDALRPAFTYTGTDLHTLLTLIEAGHGLAVLPHSAIPPNLAAIPLTTPRLIHRTELLHAHLPTPAAKALAEALSAHD